MATPGGDKGGGDGARPGDTGGSAEVNCLGREKKPRTSKRIDFGIMYGLKFNSGHDFPDGVYAELLEGYRSQDVVAETLPDLRAFLEAKGAWDVYITAMTAIQADKKFWGSHVSPKDAAAKLAEYAPALQDKGILPYFCTELVGAGSKAPKTFKWIVYVDKDVAPEGYRPPRVHGDHKCAIA